MKMKHRSLTVFFAISALILDGALTGSARAATLTVNNANDSGAGSLRATVAAAAAGDTIVFSAALSGQTITLTNGQLTLTNDLTIDASSLPEGIIISGNTNSRIFEVGSSVTNILDSLTLRDGAAPSSGYPFNSGGSILNFGTLTLNACTLQGNQAIHGDDASGGGVENYVGTLIVSNCAFWGNSAVWGGGIENDYGGSLRVYHSTFASNSATTYIGGGIDNYQGMGTVAECTFTDNFADGGGGGVENYDGPLTVSNCTFSGNSAGYGGAIENDYDTLMVYHSTFSSNSAYSDEGGGIENYEATNVTSNCTFADNSASNYGGGIENYEATLTVSNCTFSGNSAYKYDSGAIDNTNGWLMAYNSTFFTNTAAYDGGGIGNSSNSMATANNCTFFANTAEGDGGGIFNDSTSTLSLTNTIVAGNTATSGANIAGLFSGANNLTSGDPKLAPLGNYGGSTQTLPPLTGSPAIDAGDDSVASFLAADQRGYPRKFGAHVDLGAVELQGVIAGSAPQLLTPTVQSGGSLTFDFTNIADVEFVVLTSTNLALPMSQWSGLGLATQNSPGQYQFTDPNTANYPRRFYQVVSP